MLPVAWNPYHKKYPNLPKPPKPGPAINVAWNPYHQHYHLPPQPPRGAATNGFIQPPPGTYDPAIEAEREKALRGYHDIQRQTHTKLGYANEDLATALRHIKTKTQFSRGDIQRNLRQGDEKIANEREDSQRKAARQEADFHTQLANIAESFRQLGHRQTEAANASGVLDAGTQAAAAAARAHNQTHAEEPVHTAEGRLQEDLATALRRLSHGEEELGNEAGIANKKLIVGRNQSRQEARQTRKRLHDEYMEKLEIAKREAHASNLNSVEEEVWNARQNHPAAFTQKGRHKKK